VRCQAENGQGVIMPIGLLLLTEIMEISYNYLAAAALGFFQMEELVET
jgi:hypothetical protein